MSVIITQEHVRLFLIQELGMKEDDPQLEELSQDKEVWAYLQFLDAAAHMEEKNKKPMKLNRKARRALK